MTMPAEVNFTFQRGEDVAIAWTILKSQGGAVEDITGWTFALALKRQKHDPDAVATATHQITDGPAGKVTSSIAAASTATLEGEYAYSLWRTDVGAESCQAKGTISFQDTTRVAAVP
jgi:hypothetical protein